jgi:hypothetical protein
MVGLVLLWLLYKLNVLVSSKGVPHTPEHEGTAPSIIWLSAEREKCPIYLPGTYAQSPGASGDPSRRIGAGSTIRT